MEMRKGIVYKIENLLNNKIYIGQTITTLNERWSGHKSDAKRKNTPLYASIRKHHDNLCGVFSISVIEENIPYNQLDHREIFWIKELNSMYPNGYNISNGGNGFLTEEEKIRMSERVLGENNPMFGKYGELNPFYGKTHTEETKRIISEKSKGRIPSDESRKKNAASTKRRHEENGHPMKGKNHTEEAKKKISETSKGRIVSDETKRKMRETNARKKSVVMIDKFTNNKIQVFESMTIAANWINENTLYTTAKSGQISSVCVGRRKTAYGFKWEYSE